jgi:Mlc titration factor MtfA (ptsG expression regulator)
VTEREVTTLGQSWTRGNVILAWDAALGGGRDFHDGHNVVLHEFAHQLDQEDGSADGAPPLPSRGLYGPWARVLGAEYESLRGPGRHVLDEYGGTNPAEFFAVATEAFFEKPRQLRKKHPQLYEQLKAYYQQDPAQWDA